MVYKYFNIKNFRTILAGIFFCIFLLSPQASLAFSPSETGKEFSSFFTAYKETALIPMGEELKASALSAINSYNDFFSYVPPTPNMLPRPTKKVALSKPNPQVKGVTTTQTARSPVVIYQSTPPLSEAYLFTLIERILNKPEVISSLKGEKGDKGESASSGMYTNQTVQSTQPSSTAPIPSAFVPGGIVQPNSANNFGGAILFGATELSSKNFVTDTARAGSLTVTGGSTLASLTVSGGTTLSGDLSVSGTITGAIAGTINPSFTLGSVPFQGASGLTEDTDLTFATDTLTATKLITTTVNGLTLTSSTGTLTIANGKTFTSSNTLTLAGTDGSTLNIGTGGMLGTNAYTSTAYAPLASPTFTGTVTTPNLTLSSMTAGSVYFAGTGGAVTEDNSNLFWDDTNNRLGVGTTSPGGSLTLASAATLATGIQLNNAGSIGYIFGDGSLMSMRAGATYGIAVNALSASLTQSTASTGGFRIDLQTLTSSPIYSYYSDADTGIGRAAADTLTFFAGGERMRIDSAGLVGIGTTAPAALLHVGLTNNTIRYTQVSSLGILTARYDDNNAVTYPLVIENRNITAVARGAGIAFNFADTTTTNTRVGGYINVNQEQDWTSTASTRDSAIVFSNSLDGTVAEKMRISSAGNVGIGQTSPQEKLHITGNLRMGLSGSTGYYLAWGQDAVTSTGDFARIQGIRTDGTGNQAGDLVFYTKATGGGTTPDERMRISSAGNVGIGTTGPDRKLDVLDATNPQLRLTYTDGSVYTDFQSNASGNLFITGSNASPLIGIGGATSSFPALKRVATGLEVRLADDSGYAPLYSSTLSTGVITAISSALQYYSSGGSNTNQHIFSTASNQTVTSGNTFLISAFSTFAPTSGTATYSTLSLAPTINQTGGANGITRGIYINPTLTAAADFRALEISNNSGKGIYQTGASATNYFAGNVGIGMTTPNGKLVITGTSSGVDNEVGILKLTTGTGLTTDNSLIFGIHDSDYSWIQAVKSGTGYKNLSLQPTSGYVGIGTTAPSATLDVRGIIRIASDASSESAALSYDAVSNVGKWSLAGVGGTPRDQQIRLDYANGVTFHVDNNAGSTNEAMRIQRITGNVGIGITNPVGKLNVARSSAPSSATFANSYLHLGATESTTNSLRFISFGYTVGSETNVPAYIGFKETNTAGNTLGDLVFGTRAVTTDTAPTERMVITSAGNMGINDTTPDGLLDVEGTGAVTTANYGINLSNLTTNATTDAINKYGAYITSTGTWTGGAGTATNNYGLYVDTVSGADNNYGAYIAGNVGIGTTTPIYKLQVNGDIGIASGSQISFGSGLPATDLYYGMRFNSGANAVQIYTWDNPTRSIQFGVGNGSNTFTEKMRMTSAGNLGIGQTTPNNLLHVGSSSVADATALLRLQDANSTCDFTADSGSPSCGSDLTLKKDIASLNTTDLLTKISNLNPVSYKWLTDSDTSNSQYGFIAQEVALQFPELVSEHTWIDGTPRKFLNMGGLMPYVVGAIKEMNDTMQALLTGVGERVEKIFVKEIETETLCVTDSNGKTCITRAELDALLSGSGANSTPQPPTLVSTPAPACTAPQVLQNDECVTPTPEPQPEVPVPEPEPEPALEPTPEPIPEPQTPDSETSEPTE